jgi:hypothetical protein
VPRLLLLATILLGAGCDAVTSSDSDRPPPDPDPGGSGMVELRAEQIASGLASPVYLTSPRGDRRLFVVEQPGRIRIIEDGQLLSTPFLRCAASASIPPPGRSVPSANGRLAT